MTSEPTNVLVVCDGKGPTATQNISFAQPFESEAGREQINFAEACADSEAVARSFAERQPNILILSRLTSALGGEWISLARQSGTPVIFHIDDDLLAVPASLGAVKHKTYNDPDRLAALRHNIEESDLVYVSTTGLAERFVEHGIQTPIIAGDIYCSVSPGEIGALAEPATGPAIGYMGTAGHQADLRMILPAVGEVMELVPSLQFELFGTIDMPPELARFSGRVRHIAAVPNYGDFKAALRLLGWWVGLAPLEDNAFNRCKADTKWVEYSAAGTAVIASDLPVYRRACGDGAGILAQTTAHWRDAMVELLYKPDLRTSLVTAAQRKLGRSYTHETLRHQVLTVFKEASAIAARRGQVRQP